MQLLFWAIALLLKLSKQQVHVSAKVTVRY